MVADAATAAAKIHVLRFIYGLMYRFRMNRRQTAAPASMGELAACGRVLRDRDASRPGGIFRFPVYSDEMDVHLIDGTYELFRHYYAVPAAQDNAGREIGAVRGVLGSVVSMIDQGAMYLGVATDHVVESFRNNLYAGYKTSEGVDPQLLSQFPILEEALDSMGVVVWPMIEFEADDGLASAAAKAARDARVGHVIICTPDKDLGQCVSGTRVVQLDRRRNIVRDEAGVIARFGVRPESIPDYLALVGDTADGFPGVSGWGEKAASQMLARYGHLEDIPKDWREWNTPLRNVARLAGSLLESWENALLFRRLATLRLDAPVSEAVDELRWHGPRPSFSNLCRSIKAPDLYERVLSAQAKASAQAV